MLSLLGSSKSLTNSSGLWGLPLYEDTPLTTQSLLEQQQLLLLLLLLLGTEGAAVWLPQNKRLKGQQQQLQQQKQQQQKQRPSLGMNGVVCALTYKAIRGSLGNLFLL